MDNDFCPRDCKYLNYTEQEQNMLNEPVVHKCLKYDVRLFHLMAQPDLYRCEQCFKESDSQASYIDTDNIIK